jgi:hypothetical protein
VFKSKLEFIGMVDGKPVIADVTYRGITKVGGDINAQLHFTEGLKGVLKVDAIVAVGGSYRGLIEN